MTVYYNRTRAKAEALVAQGAKAAASVSDALRIKVRKRSAPNVAGFYSATQPQNAAAPWPKIAPPRTRSPENTVKSWTKASAWSLDT